MILTVGFDQPNPLENEIWVHFWVQIETVGDNGRLPTRGGKTSSRRMLSATMVCLPVQKTFGQTRVFRIGLSLVGCLIGAVAALDWQRHTGDQRADD